MNLFLLHHISDVFNFFYFEHFVHIFRYGEEKKLSLMNRTVALHHVLIWGGGGGGAIMQREHDRQKGESA